MTRTARTPEDALVDRLREFYGVAEAVLVGRARAGLVALAEVLGLAGKTVVLPSNLCPVVAVALDAARMRLRLAPVALRSGLADDERLVAAMADQPEPGMVMPTHLYGQLGGYARTLARARQDGWFVLENDTLCAARVRHGRRQAFGDALLTSFGNGKTASAGGGGALLTDDPVLAAALRRAVRDWPQPGADAAAVESHVMLVRRHLRPLGRAGLAEGLLGVEQQHLRHAFPPALTPAVLEALDRVETTLDRRAEVAAAWDEALASLDDRALQAPTLPVTAPWRLVRRVVRTERRDGLAAALRAEGFDVGINFPALSDSFPRLLGKQAHADADTWSAGVLNLWLDASLTPQRMRQAAELIARQLDAAPAAIRQAA